MNIKSYHQQKTFWEIFAAFNFSIVCTSKLQNRKWHQIQWAQRSSYIELVCLIAKQMIHLCQNDEGYLSPGNSIVLGAHFVETQARFQQTVFFLCLIPLIGTTDTLTLLQPGDICNALTVHKNRSKKWSNKGSHSK